MDPYQIEMINGVPFVTETLLNMPISQYNAMVEERKKNSQFNSTIPDINELIKRMKELEEKAMRLEEKVTNLERKPKPDEDQIEKTAQNTEETVKLENINKKSN